MKDFMVNVCRIGYAFGEIPVNAETQEEANEKALDGAGDYCYSEKSAEYRLADDLDGGATEVTRLLKLLHSVVNKDKDGGYFVCNENSALLNEVGEFLGLK